MNVKIKGKIQRIEKATTTKGKHFVKLLVNDDIIFVWNPSMVSILQEYDEVELEHDGEEFPKLVSIRKILGSEAAASSQTEAVPAKKEVAYFSVDRYRDELKSIFEECAKDAFDVMPPQLQQNEHIVADVAIAFFEKRARPQHYAQTPPKA